MHVKLSNVISAQFGVSNGVRQVGILSQVSFNLYVDDLSVQLSAHNIGFMIGENLVNLHMYAHDLVILSPSSAGLQGLLDIQYVIVYGVQRHTKAQTRTLPGSAQTINAFFPLPLDVCACG